MKNNFINQMFRDGGFNASSLTGATPWGAIAQIGGGLLQSIIGGIGQRKAQKRFEGMLNQSPQYKQNESITDYYNKALQRYNVNPYQSDLYKMQEQQANRGLTTGISALQDRRSALSGIGSLIQGRSDSMLRAGSQAEQQQSQNLAQLGNAANAKTSEDAKAFEINKMMPYQAKLNQLAAKASGNAQVTNAGLSNIFGGLQGVGDFQMAKTLFNGEYGLGNSSMSNSQNGISLLDVMGNRKNSYRTRSMFK